MKTQFEVKLYTKTGIFCEIIEAASASLAIRKARQIARDCGVTGKFVYAVANRI